MDLIVSTEWAIGAFDPMQTGGLGPENSLGSAWGMKKRGPPWGDPRRKEAKEIRLAIIR
jgi:hypothetical protein